MVQGPLYTTGQQPPQSSSAPTNLHLRTTFIFSDATCTGDSTAPSSWISELLKNNSTKGRQFTDRAQFWEFCIREMWRKDSLMHQKQLVNHGRAVAGGHEQASKRRDARIYYIVDMWTATGTRVQPTQGKVRKSFATYWWYRRPKLDEWMKDWPG